MLQLRDKRYNDIRLIFKEEGHSYHDTLNNPYLSTTTILGNYKKPFDKKYWLKRKAKELNVSTKSLNNSWENIKNEACDRGNVTHNELEDGVRINSMFQKAVKYLQPSNGEMITIADLPNINYNIKPLDVKEFIDFTNNKYPEIYRVFDYYTSNGYKIYAEIGAFLIDYLLSGTIDILCIRDDKFVIGDWKTNRGGLKFESGYYKKDKTQIPHQQTNNWVKKEEFLLPPVNNLEACNGNIYNLQLSIYAIMVEIILGIPCAGLWLCHIDSDFVLNEYGVPKLFNNGYRIKDEPIEKCTLHKMKYLKQEVIRILEDRKKIVNASRNNNRTLFD